MQIYLTRPGGEREGPYTVEEINRDLAAKRYADTDYWAWFTGQTEWIPLHKVPGVVGSDSTTAARHLQEFRSRATIRTESFTG